MRVDLAAFCIVFVVASAAAAGDWPGWRGPSGQGISDEKGLPQQWDGKKGENVLWKVPLPFPKKARLDNNQSSPIVYKDRVYVTVSFWPEGVDASKKQPEHRVICYDVADGKLQWDVGVEPGPWQFGDLRGGYTAPTPTCDGERVYVVFGSSVIAALDLNGKQLWRKEIKPFDFDVAMASSPVLYGDTILLQCDGVKKSSRLVAFDRKTGDIRWEKKRPNNDFCHSTPILVKIKDKDQLLTAASNALQGLDPSTGDILWWCAAKGDTVSPVMAGDRVYLDSGRGGLGVAVDPTGSGDVSNTHLKWKLGQVPEGFSSPLIVGEYLFRLHSPGVLKCYKCSDGTLIYSERLEGVSSTSSPIATGDALVYCGSAGKTHIVKPGPKLEVVAVNDLGDSSASSVAVSSGRLYIKGREHLYCIGSKK